jgi:SulP family sulfate permease
LYAAIIPVLIACLWGSSWHLICGPTAAISIVLYASVSPLAVPGSQDYITLILLLTSSPECSSGCWACCASALW